MQDLYGVFLPFPGLYFWDKLALCGFLTSHVAEPDLEFIIDVCLVLDTLSLLQLSETHVHHDVCFVPDLPECTFNQSLHFIVSTVEWKRGAQLRNTFKESKNRQKKCRSA